MTRALPFTVGLFAALCACRSGQGPPRALVSDAAAAAAAAMPVVDCDGGRPQVELTWRLFETRRWLEGADRRESAVIELLVNGGTPARIDLGRRDTLGCAVTREGGAALTGLLCSSARARVERPSPGELRVVAGDGDDTRDEHAPLLRVTTVTVRVPADAELIVDGALSRIPDEAPGL